MEILFDVAKWLLSKSDPMLVVCFLVLAFWQHRTAKLLAEHVDAKNDNPHPSCKLHESVFEGLRADLQRYHGETREDIKSLGDRMDTVIKCVMRKENQ